MPIELFSKNLAHIGSVEIPAGSPTPRVGEFIVSPAHAGDAGQLNTFLVVEVSYHLGPQGLTPEVRAMAQGDDASNRLHRLQECGWLPPAPD